MRRLQVLRREVDPARSGDVIGVIKGGWILLTVGGIIGLVGLVLAAVLPASIDQRSLACGFEFASNAGVLEGSLDAGRCSHEGSGASEGEGELESLAADTTVH